MKNKVGKILLKKRTLLLLALLTSCLATGAVYGRYGGESLTVSSSGRVAKFDVSVELLGYTPETYDHQLTLETDGAAEVLFMVTNHNEVTVEVKATGLQIDSNTAELAAYRIDQPVFLLEPGASMQLTVTIAGAATNVFFETVQNLALSVAVAQVD